MKGQLGPLMKWIIITIVFLLTVTLLSALLLDFRIDDTKDATEDPATVEQCRQACLHEDLSGEPAPTGLRCDCEAFK